MIRQEGNRCLDVGLPRGLERYMRFCDLGCHFYDGDEELERLLNQLGDHFIRRVLPELSEPEPKVERPEYTVTKEMHDRLESRKEELAGQFMERHGLDWSEGTDEVMGQLLREAGQVKGKPFQEVEGKLVELAAVYGEVLIRTVGGEWARKKDEGKIVIGNFAFTHQSIVLLNIICYGWSEGEITILTHYMYNLSEYRKWTARQRDEYGDSWQPPRIKKMAGESLLDGKAVEETIGKEMADAGFVYCGGSTRGWTLERESTGGKETIQVRDDGAGRQAFFAIHHMPGREGGAYRYREFCFYRNREDMRAQLERIGKEMKAAFLDGRGTEAAWKMPSFRCHLTRKMKGSVWNGWKWQGNGGRRTDWKKRQGRKKS